MRTSLWAFITDPWTVESQRFLQGEKQLYGMKSTLYVPKYPCMCVCMCAFTHNFQVCLHTFTRTQFKHTHSDVTCVCFTFSILGCYCFVAVLGAAAQRVEAEEEGEVLDRHRCLLALAALRHAKWFQVGTHSLPVFLPDAYCSLTIHPEGCTHYQLILWCSLCPLTLNESRISVEKAHIFYEHKLEFIC